MKKIVSNVLIVSTQLIIGGLFLFMLFSKNSENSRVVVIENNNLDKMADAVSDLFVADQLDNEEDEEDTETVDLISEEERIAAEEAAAEAARIAAEEEAARIAAEEAEAERIRIATSCTNDTKTELQSYAYDLVINTYGWTEADYCALVSLWNAESGWCVTATNSSSGAYGIPQALPASKMEAFGSDYLTNGETQIRWGLSYISSSYSTPSNAWSHFQNNGWY